MFADPANVEARQLQADALEQLGYQAESGQWRNFYLTAASELRYGVMTAGTTRTLSPDMVSALSLDDFFDYLAVRLNGPKAAGKTIVINFRFRDSGDDYLITLNNGVLHSEPRTRSSHADATVTLTRGGLVAIAMLGQAVNALTMAGLVDIEGDAAALEQLIALLDNYEFWFNIVTP